MYYKYLFDEIKIVNFMIKTLRAFLISYDSYSFQDWRVKVVHAYQTLSKFYCVLEYLEFNFIHSVSVSKLNLHLSFYSQFTKSSFFKVTSSIRHLLHATNHPSPHFTTILHNIQPKSSMDSQLVFGS